MARALVIDDDPDVRGLLRLVLEGAGHEVEEAGDGAEGLRRHAARPADVVYCDVFMEGLNGLDTIRALRAGCPAVRIVAMSGGSFDGWGVLPVAAELGADVTLAKPFTEGDILAAAAPGHAAS
jgi:two-component system chemotaxis response regulator CheY